LSASVGGAEEERHRDGGDRCDLHGEGAIGGNSE
jgi:hypothetical protein